MIETLVIIGWIAIVYLTVTIALIAYFLIPSFFVKSNDPSGGLLEGFFNMMIVFWCILWPIAIPMEIWKNFKKKP